MSPYLPVLITLAAICTVFLLLGFWMYDLIRKLKYTAEQNRADLDRFRDFYQTASEGFCFLDPTNEVLINPNPAFCTWFGISAGDSQRLDILAPADSSLDLGFIRKNVERALRDKPQAFDLPVQSAGGKCLWLHVHISTATLEGRQVILIRAVDIAAVKKAEEDYEQLSSILESIGEGVVTVDMGGKITYVNKAWADMHCISRSELPGKNVCIFHTEKQFKHDVLPYNQIVMRKGIHSGEVGHRHSDGTEFPTYMTTTLQRDKTGRPIGFISVAADLSEQKKVEDALRMSEIKFRHLFNLSPEPITVSDLTGKILDVNEKVCEFLGYSRYWIIGKTVLELGFPAEQWQQIINTLTLRGELTGFEVSLTNQNRHTHHLLMFAKLIEIKSEFFILSILHDVTEQRNLEDRLRDSQKLEAIGTLAGGIAHDFNNILSAILGYVELSIIKTDRESKVYNYLDQVLKATNRARDLVRQILSVSRQTEQRRKPVSVPQLVEDVLKLMRASLPSSVEIRDDIDRQTGPIMADPGQIHQVLMNLCTNAGQSMNDTGGVLTVKLEKMIISSSDTPTSTDVPPGAYILITVSDTGHGMPYEVQKRIFDPYFTTKVKGMGTGLGLAVVQGIIKKHGGKVSFYSRPGEGTSFYVYLPMIQQVDSGRALPQPLADETLPGGNECILLVDDEESITDTGRQMLEHLGYKVEVSSGSLEALALFQCNPHRFDLVITDMTMPEMTGDELAGRLMEIRPEIPVILCTGYNSRIDEESAKAMGIHAFVFKPIKLKILARTVREVIETRTAQTAAES